MTTIAYRNGVMAADRLVSNGGGGRAGHQTKIARGPKGTIGGMAGRMEEGFLFARWVENDCEGDPPPLSDSADGIVLLPNGLLCYVGEKGCLCPVEAEFAAVGSGEAYAIGAMAHGASAAEAIEIAIQFDTGSGGGVDVLKREVTNAQPD